MPEKQLEKDARNARPGCSNWDLKQNMSCRVILYSAWKNTSTRKHRKLIGWDEILEGGLAENATVMSWRGEKGGIEAAQTKP